MDRQMFWIQFSIATLVAMFFGPILVQDLQSEACKASFEGEQERVECILHMYNYK